MPSIAIQEAFIAVTGASALGALTVASNAYVFPGALAWVSKDDGSAQARVKILACIGSTIVQVRRFANDDDHAAPNSYGKSDMSAFNAGSHICMEAQNAPIDPVYAKRVLP